MGKYEQVATYLIGRNRKRVVMTFAEVERLIGAPLPVSARKHQRWWRGNSATWLKVGWRGVPDFPKQKVTFIRDKHAKKLKDKRIAPTRVPGRPAKRRRIRRWALGKKNAPWGRGEFRLVVTLQPRSERGRIWEDYPHLRYEKKANSQLHAYGAGPFCRFSVPDNIHEPGVYLLIVNGDVKYVGETEDLSRRFNNGYGTISPRNCYVGGQSTNCRINNLILGSASAGVSVHLQFRQTGDHKKLETELIASLSPPWNNR